MSGDVKAISAAPGIGRKTAEKLIVELKDKLKIEDLLDHARMAVTDRMWYPEGRRTAVCRRKPCRLLWRWDMEAQRVCGP